jgi:hypothetical protein
VLAPEMCADSRKDKGISVNRFEACERLRSNRRQFGSYGRTSDKFRSAGDPQTRRCNGDDTKYALRPSGRSGALPYAPQCLRR